MTRASGHSSPYQMSLNFFKYLGDKTLAIK